VAKPPAVDTSETLVGGEIRVCDERPTRRGELVLGRYRLAQRLGSGGFGTVWSAQDEQLGRTVALKRIALPSAQERERALREARATARLAHPSIVALYEACADEDSFYLISELVEGDTLADLIAADELDDEEIAAIGVALVDGLEHAHARGVIHRDVKPRNVLVPRSAEPPPAAGSAPTTAKLADFGGALLTGGDALTRTGEVYGTLAYMAPEQSDGHQVGPAADLYSLALVLYEALSGVNPVCGRTPAATARRIGAPIESLRRRRRDLPRELTRAIDAALVADPRRRGALAELREPLSDVADSRPRARRTTALSPARRTLLAPMPARQPHRRDLPPTRREPVGADRGEAEPVVAADPQAQAPPLAPPVATARRSPALPRLVWIALALAAAVWQALSGLPGVALLVLAAAAPLALLPRRAGPGWMAAAAAPALGALGLAGAFPALAGQRARPLARAGLAALGFWWLALAEPLLARRLWLGVPPGTPTRAAWERSFAPAAHLLGDVLTLDVAIGAAVWALAAAALPWIVRGRNAAVDVLAAVAWTIFLLGAVPVSERALLHHAAPGNPRGVVLGAALGCALAVCARALRGPA